MFSYGLTTGWCCAYNPPHRRQGLTEDNGLPRLGVSELPSGENGMSH